MLAVTKRQQYHLVKVVYEIVRLFFVISGAKLPSKVNNRRIYFDELEYNDHSTYSIYFSYSN